MRLLSVRESSQLLGVSISQVNKLIKNGKIEATKVGHYYTLTPEAVAAYGINRRSVGRPRKNAE